MPVFLEAQHGFSLFTTKIYSKILIVLLKWKRKTHHSSHFSFFDCYSNEFFAPTARIVQRRGTCSS
jgi:hypothetical protein